MQEERDVLFGQVFGILAIVRSGRLVQAGSRAAGQVERKASAASEPEELPVDIVNHLVGVATKKSFISELAHQTLITFLSQVSPLTVPNGQPSAHPLIALYVWLVWLAD